MNYRQKKKIFKKKYGRWSDYESVRKLYILQYSWEKMGEAIISGFDGLKKKIVMAAWLQKNYRPKEGENN